MQLDKQVFTRPPQVRRTFAGSFFRFIALVCLLSGAAMFAQLAGKGAISGNVEDPTGAAIPKAMVKATNTATGVSVSVTSTDVGDYLFSSLDPGTYTITVEAQGFEIQRQENVNVNALASSIYNPKLTLGSSSETVTVSTVPAQLQTSDAALGGTLEAEMYSALPIEMGAFGSQDQRRATDFAQLLPGVQGNQTSGGTTTNSGLVNGVGARGGAEAIYVNGVPFTNVGGEGDPRFVWSAISVDAVSQFQVQTSGYSAMYEGEGVQNYNVKQGGNAYHGTVYEFFRNTALDTWGFYKQNSPYTGLPSKPVEHQNEYGISLSGPLLPFGSLRDKLFYFGNYNGYRLASTKPILQNYPTVAEQHGDFSAIAHIYDPNTQLACTQFYGYTCRYQFGYTHGTTAGSAQIPNGQPIDVIPQGEMSQVAQAMQAALPNSQLINTNPTNNFVAANLKALNNQSTTHRIDFVASTKDVLTLTGAYGRQVSNSPVGSTNSTNNLGPLPYNYGQSYAPKTYVGIVEETHQFSPNLINQVNAGFGRYASLDYNANQVPQYAPAAYGYNVGPVGGQASEAFPSVKFSGIDAPTNFAGYNAVIGIANSYELLDNVQWTRGKHAFTIGGMISWLQYYNLSAAGGSTPVTISNKIDETAAIQAPTSTSSGGGVLSSTGVAYASFLLGQPDSVTFTQNSVPATHARFRPMSPYIQDIWKVSNKLTLDLGVRYDFYPTYREAHDVLSYFDPNLPNPVTGVNGALNFTGHGAGTCNCDTPVHNYFKNIGPRIGLTYQLDPKTVVRSSYGVIYSHGNGVGGSSASSQGTKTQGYSASPNFAANTSTHLTTAPLDAGVPSYTLAAGIASGPQYGTGYSQQAGYTGTPQTSYYGDPYYGGRAPQFINYTLGFQHQWTKTFNTSLSYVGSQAHFLMSDGGNARGYWSDQLDPKYLSLGSCLNLKISALTSSCQTAVQQSGAVIPSTFNTGQALYAALLPFPQSAVNDNYGQVSNAHYNALQVVASMRLTHGVTISSNYTWGRAIDDAGSFRTGYAIPAAYSNTGRSYAADARERGVSVTNQTHHFVFTGVEHLPFGSGRWGGEHAWTRALFGGFEFSQIVQSYSGSPLAITASACQINPAQVTCSPTLNPAFSGNVRTTKHWSGFGPNIANSIGSAPSPTGTSSPITPTGPFYSPVLPTCSSAGVLTPGGGSCVPKTNYGVALTDTPYIPSYMFGNAPRTAAYGLTGPGFFGMDISLRRSFPLHITDMTKLNLQADLYNVTNFVQFGNVNTSVGNASFSQPSSQNNNPRQAQLSARIEF